MRYQHLLLSFSLGTVTAAYHQLPRFIGESCFAPEGSGTCQATSECAGISYPNNLCPHDPNEVQCCVPQKCSAPYVSSLCRHTNQGCSGGSFVENHCPGGADIQCCVKDPAADKPSCSNPAENTCTFYSDCLEKRVQCGSEGYPLGYGLKYCNKFTSVRSDFSASGQDWITKTMLCLQRSLIPYATGDKSDTCANLKDFAFDTHPGCYVSSGLCILPSSDWGAIISTVSLKELFGSIDALKESLETASDCVDFYKWLIGEDIIKLTHEVEDEAKSIWEKITDWF